MIGLGGVGLSAGQMQRVAIARALFDNPVLLLLDEPNAHLDGDTDALLMRTLTELKAQGATLIVSAHRTGILQVADKILVLQDGRIHAFGAKDEVLRPRGAQFVSVGAPDSSGEDQEVRPASGQAQVG